MLIIRRGPSRVFHLIAWDTETDELEHGSWFRGRLYPLRCDLSFDGKWFVYFAFGPTRELYSWVAISRPPWLRAEVLWPQSGAYGGGGVFLGPQILWLPMSPDARPRAGDRFTPDWRMHVVQSQTPPGESEYEAPFYRRLKRDGWQREGDPSEAPRQGTGDGRDSGWSIRPTSHHPALRMYDRGYSRRRGDVVYEYALDDFSALLDTTVEWAGWDTAGRLVIARVGAVERFTLADLATGTPSFRFDLNDMTPPSRPAPGERRASRAAGGSRPDAAIDDEERYYAWLQAKTGEPRGAAPGSGVEECYYYRGAAENRRHAAGRTGYPIRSADEFTGLARLLTSDVFRRPQIYVVNLAGVFVLGGELDAGVAVAGGEPVLAAGEAMLEEDTTGRWRIAALNNRSYDYMPEVASWAAVDRALAGTGIEYPREGFSEVHPLEGTWGDVLAALRD
jgi:hypothetical protein